MKLKEKLKGKYYKLAVHVVGTDCNNYNYTKKDIKQLFTSEAGKTNYTYLHGGNQLGEITTVANYISEVDEVFNEGKETEKLIPAGSHIKIIHSNNCKLNEAIHNKIINAVSSEQAPNLDLNCSHNTKKLIDGVKKNGRTTPHDIEDMECVIYNTLAFVEQGCNGVGIEEIDYNVYIENTLNYNKNKEEKTMGLKKEDLDVITEVSNLLGIKNKSVTSEDVEKIVDTELQGIEKTIEKAIDAKLSVLNEKIGKIDSIAEKFEEPKAWLESVADKAFWDKIRAQDDEYIADQTQQVADQTLDILNEKEQEELVKQLEAEGFIIEKPKPEIEDAKAKLEDLGYNITVKNDDKKEKKNLKLQLDDPKDIVINNTARQVNIKAPTSFANFDE